VQSVVLYGSETWTMRKVDSDRIQSFHMQALRRILGIRWYDKVYNAEMIERTKLPNSLIADRRHSLFGHICRLPENTPASQALQLSIEAHTSTPPAADWKRPPGRPRRNWLQQVKEDIGLSVGAVQITGQDRSMWRTLRPSAGQAQQWVSEWGVTRDDFNVLCTQITRDLFAIAKFLVSIQPGRVGSRDQFIWPGSSSNEATTFMKFWARSVKWEQNCELGRVLHSRVFSGLLAFFWKTWKSQGFSNNFRVGPVGITCHKTSKL